MRMSMRPRGVRWRWTDLIQVISEDLNLNIQLASSWVHIQVTVWAHMTSTPDIIYTDILAKFPALQGLPVQLNSAKVLGCPLGLPAYCRTEMDKVALNIIKLYCKIKDVPDGRIHFQLFDPTELHASKHPNTLSLWTWWRHMIIYDDWELTIHDQCPTIDLATATAMTDNPLID
eukprot:1491966-Rhodomonas_salina.2